MTSQAKPKDSNKEMLDWQLRVILQQLDQVQLHASDPTCPCRLKDIGEYCVPKHLNLLASLAYETAAMDSRNDIMLFDLGNEATEFHLKTKDHVCGKGEDLDVVTWSRSWRKKIEPAYYACSVKKARLGDAVKEIAQLMDVPVKVAGRCDAKECNFKVSATQTMSASTGSVKSLGPLIKEVAAQAEKRRSKTANAQELAASNRTFAMGITRDTRYEFEWRIVDGQDLVVSNDPFTFEPNPQYSRELQPRDRNRAATKLQVETMAGKLVPDLLLLDFLSLDKGSPIIGPDNLVECGNGRVMALLRAAKENPDGFAAYREKLEKLAPQYGLSVSSVTAIAVPILVRVRLTLFNNNEERQAFTEECNARVGIQSSAIENARNDAERITPEMLAGLEVLEGESIEKAIRAARNKAFVTSFLNKLPVNEQAGQVDSKGVLSQDGVRRMVMAIFLATFRGDAGLILGEKFFEANDPDVKNVFAGILQSLGPLSRAEVLAVAGERETEYAIGEDLARVIAVYSRIKTMPDYSVAKYMSQLSLGERELNAFQERVLDVLDHNARSAKKIGRILNLYGQTVIDSPPPGQQTLIAMDKSTKRELFDSAVKRALDEDLEKIAHLFDRNKDVPPPMACNPIKVHDDGDRTIKCGRTLFVTTPDGKVFKQVKRVVLEEADKRERCILDLKERNIEHDCHKPEGSGTKDCPNVFAVCNRSVPKAVVADPELEEAAEALKHTIEVD